MNQSFALAELNYWFFFLCNRQHLSYGNGSLHVDAAFQQTLWSVAPICSGSEVGQGKPERQLILLFFPSVHQLGFVLGARAAPSFRVRACAYLCLYSLPHWLLFLVPVFLHSCSVVGRFPDRRGCPAPPPRSHGWVSNCSIWGAWRWAKKVIFPPRLHVTDLSCRQAKIIFSQLFFYSIICTYILPDIYLNVFSWV